MLKFLLQADEVSLMEKRAVNMTAMLRGYETKRIPLAEIHKSDFDKDLIPVGTVEFVKAVMTKHNITIPKHISYPECLLSFTKRIISMGTLESADDSDFVKPFENVKLFTGCIKSELSGISKNELVYISEPISFVSEVRYYVLDGKICGCGRYDDANNDLEPNYSEVLDAISTMYYFGYKNFSLDFGLLDNGETALVEANDAWALGLYKGTCSNDDYSNLLAKRWKELSC